MAALREGKREFVVLDVLHRETLEAVLIDRGVETATLDPIMLTDWTHAWHRLDPWPDAVEGLARLRTRFPVVTLSNVSVR